MPAERELVCSMQVATLRGPQLQSLQTLGYQAFQFTFPCCNWHALGDPMVPASEAGDLSQSGSSCSRGFGGLRLFAEARDGTTTF